MRTRLVFGALIAFVSACGESTPMTGTGGGAGGGTGGGGGSSKVDAGTKKDAGITPVDAGNQAVDSGQPAVDAGQAVDAGSVTDAGSGIDAGTTVDAGQPADAGAGVDAGTGVVDAGTGGIDSGTPDAGPSLITWVALTGPRRGPIELTFTLGASDFTAFTLKVDKGGFVSTTLLTTERVGNTLTLIWDSFSDVSVDGVVSLKLEGTRAAGNAQVSFQLDVRNGIAPDRLISVAQALEPSAGGATSTGNGVSLVKWSPVDGGIATRRFTTVAAVQRVRAAPHGRSTAVLGQSQVMLVKTPLDADTVSATTTAAVTVPGAPVDMHWSHDGRFLYVLTGLDNGRQPTLERLRVKEDQSGIEPAVTVIGLDRPPLRFDIDPTGRFVIVVGSGMSASTGKLLLLEADGGSAATPIDRDWGLPSALAVSPRGDLVVMTHFLFAYEVFIIPLGPSGFGSVTVRTDIDAPYDVRFDPRSDSTTRNFVVSQTEQSRLTSVTATGAVTVHPAVTGISAPGELDFIERGSQVSTGFSTAFQRIYAFNVDTSGLIQSLRLVTNFGTDVTNDPTGIAVQR